MVALVKTHAPRPQTQSPQRYFLLQTEAGAISAHSRKDGAHQIAMPLEVSKIVKGKVRTERVQAFVSLDDYLRLTTLAGGSAIKGSAPLEKGVTVRAKAPEHHASRAPRKTKTIAEWADAKHAAANKPIGYPADLFKHHARDAHLTLAKPNPKTLAAMFPSTSAPAQKPARAKSTAPEAAPAPKAVVASNPAPVATVVAPVVIAAPKPQAKTAEPAATTLRPFARRIEAESEIRTVETRANNVIKSYFVALGMNGRVTYSYDLDDKGLPTKVKVSGVSSADIAAFTSRISAALTEAYTKGYASDANNPNLDRHRLQRAVLTLEKEHVGKKGPFRSHDRSVLVQ
jgi:hypothetical protein